MQSFSYSAVSFLASSTGASLAAGTSCYRKLENSKNGNLSTVKTVTVPLLLKKNYNAEIIEELKALEISKEELITERKGQPYKIQNS